MVFLLFGLCKSDYQILILNHIIDKIIRKGHNQYKILLIKLTKNG